MLHFHSFLLLPLLNSNTCYSGGGLPCKKKFETMIVNVDTNANAGFSWLSVCLFFGGPWRSLHSQFATKWFSVPLLPGYTLRESKEMNSGTQELKQRALNESENSCRHFFST